MKHVGYQGHRIMGVPVSWQAEPLALNKSKVVATWDYRGMYFRVTGKLDLRGVRSRFVRDAMVAEHARRLFHELHKVVVKGFPHAPIPLPN